MCDHKYLAVSALILHYFQNESTRIKAAQIQCFGSGLQNTPLHHTAVHSEDSVLRAD